MKEFRYLWWAIQVNAAICFLLVGYAGVQSESIGIKVFAFLALFSAAVVEYAAYKAIYKPYVSGSRGQK